MDLSKLTPQSPQSNSNGEDASAKAQKAEQEAQMKREMIATILEQDARERRTPVYKPSVTPRL
jgi:DNA-binding TFAR19-related protein (PDSD5 family)